MHVFVTGATGWVGSAVVKELLAAGHSVSGLTTSPAGAEKLRTMGIKPYVGKLRQHDVLRRAAAEADGVIHTAFIHGLSHMSLYMRGRLLVGAISSGIYASYMRVAGETEATAIGALGSALEKSGRPLIVASGILNLPQGQVATEQDDHVESPRPTESAAFKFLDRGVRVAAVRLSPTVHGDGDHGFVARIIQAARKKGVSPYIGEGANRWTTVHRLDAAKLFQLALERGAAGAKYHAVAESGVSFREIACLIASRLKVPAVSISADKAAAHFGILARPVGMDNPASSTWTRQTLGWMPEREGLLADMSAHYLNAVA